MLTKRLSMVGVLLFALAIPSAFADTYYVSTTGDDDDTGGVNDPFLTIKHGCSVLEEGDTLIIQPGDYIGETNIDLTDSGSSGNPITIKAMNPNTVFIKRTATLGDYGSDICFNINQDLTAPIYESEAGDTPRSYVVLENLNISYYMRGVIFHGGGHHTIDHCVFTSNGGEVYGSAVWFLYTSDAEVTDSRFYDLLTNPDPNDDPTIQDYAIACYGTDNCLIEHCYFCGRHNQTVSFKDGSSDGTVQWCVFEGAPRTAIYLGQDNNADSCLGTYDACTDMTVQFNIIRPISGFPVRIGIYVNDVDGAYIYRNYIESPNDGSVNANGICVGCQAAGTVEVYCNVIAHSAYHGMWFNAPNITNLNVYHNTLYHCWANANAEDFFFCGSGAPKTGFKNNLIFMSKSFESGLPASNMQLNLLCDDECLFTGPLTQPALPTNYYREIDFTSYWVSMMNPFFLCDGDQDTTSIGIDAGEIISGWPWLYNGTAPDVGAFEHY